MYLKKLLLLISFIFITSIAFADSPEQVAKQRYENWKKENTLLHGIGKARTFSKEEFLKAKDLLENQISKNYLSVLGKFRKKDELVLFKDDKTYPFKGYYVVDFLVEKSFGTNKTLEENTIKIRIPYDFFHISSTKYVNNINKQKKELFMAQKKMNNLYNDKEITQEQYDHYMHNWKRDLYPLRYALNLLGRISAGQRFSLDQDNFLIFLKRPENKEFQFAPNDIWPIGYGTFADIILSERYTYKN